MKRCIIMPDSYKGTLSSLQICNTMENVIKRHFPECETIKVPMADGGEGTVDCFLYATDAQKIQVRTTGPYGETIETYYARLGDTAVIEMASAAGLVLAKNSKYGLNPRKTTTYGVGLMMKHAIDHGCKEIILGLGGSCTNDAGVGAARALGTCFFDTRGKEFIPTADTLLRIADIDNSIAEERLQGVKVTAMCDIDNPLFGPEGAAYVFAPQKGADDATVRLLDSNLRGLADIIEGVLGKRVSQMPGAGAAGGFGAGVVSFFQGKLRSGIDTLLDLVHFDDLLEGTDMIFTGEGRIDSQSLRGKAVIGIAMRAKVSDVPVVAVVGSIAEDITPAYDMGVTSIFSINRAPMSFEEVKEMSEQNLADTMDSLMRFYRCVEER
ncbi:glycerate kinase family protein [Anaerosporobacter faecicola]|uniref:glycerate kinase family protein n=1 Tax=Anaerosporobacter faecicola TaxID=2718714 RepID=UPI00143AD9AF|nr:glycerate kinase [Anaerosporobacter faecicola]